MKKLFSILTVFTAFAVAFLFGDAHGAALATGLVAFAGGQSHLSDKEQVELMASQFSKFEEDFDGYAGRKLPLTQGVFTFSISNGDTSAQNFYLFSAYQLDAMGFGTSFGAGASASRYGQMVDGVFRGIGSTTANISASGDTATAINEWLAYCKNIKGNKVTKIVVRSASPLVHSQRFVITKRDPLNQLSDRTIRLSTWRNPMQQDLNTTIIQEGFELGTQDFIQFSVPPSVTDLVVELHMNGYAS